jgi:hypothetical protein
MFSIWDVTEETASVICREFIEINNFCTKDSFLSVIPD